MSESLPSWFEMVAAAPMPLIPNLIALDPGETTGYAHFKSGALVSYGQLETGAIDIVAITALQSRIRIASLVAVENYQVYAWKTKSHAWDTLHTPRLIGCIECLCALEGKKLYKQTAQNAKKFASDNKLRHWGMYARGQPHARDAIRHGVFRTMFNK